MRNYEFCEEIEKEANCRRCGNLIKVGDPYLCRWNTKVGLICYCLNCSFMVIEDERELMQKMEDIFSKVEESIRQEGSQRSLNMGLLRSSIRCLKCKRIQEEIIKRESFWRLEKIWGICKIKNSKWKPLKGYFWMWEKPCGLRKIRNMFF